jgi:hypothetical protein
MGKIMKNQSSCYQKLSANYLICINISRIGIVVVFYILFFLEGRCFLKKLSFLSVVREKGCDTAHLLRRIPVFY